MLRSVGALLCALALAGCAHPARIQTNLDIAGRPPGLAVITLQIKNADSSATTPLLVEVVAQFRNSGSAWGEPRTVLHPAGFVLKKQEQQILRVTLKTAGGEVRATATVKEQETGKQVGYSSVVKSVDSRP